MSSSEPKSKNQRKAAALIGFFTQPRIAEEVRLADAVAQVRMVPQPEIVWLDEAADFTPEHRESLAR